MTEVTFSSARRAKLTKRTVDAAQPADGRLIVWDVDLPGFGLRIEPTGRKTFIARYRAGGGRSGTLRQATIGRFGVLTVDEARREARKLLGAAVAGGDPVGDRQRARQAGITIREVTAWYMREATTGRILGRRGQPIKRSTLATDRMRIDAHVLPLLGNRRVDSLRLRDLEQMQADIAAGKTAKKISHGERHPQGGVPRGGSGTAGWTLGMLHSILEHAVRHQLIETNPARGARKFAYQRRTRRLTMDEMRELGWAMREASATENPTGLAAIRLLALTGLRRGEALGLRPEWVVSGGINFPDSKTGAHLRPIGKAALDLLASQVAEHPKWIFPGDRGDGHFVGLPNVLARVCRMAGLNGVTPHVLRHSYASIAAELGFSELTIAGLLGHAAGSVTAGYVHLDQALVSAADRVAGSIAGVLDEENSRSIIPFRRALSQS